MAEDRYVAEDALELIDVVYEPCRSRPRSPPRWPRTPPACSSRQETNNVAVIRMRVGDADCLGGAPWCCVSASRTAPDRLRAGDAGPGGGAPDRRGGELHLLGSTKCIHINRTILAPFWNTPGALHSPRWMWAGGSGPRRAVPRGHPRPARTCGRAGPCGGSRVVESLTATNHARQVEHAIEMAFERDGRIRAIRDVIHADIQTCLYGRAGAGGVRRAAARTLPGAQLCLRSLVRGDQQDAGGHAAPPGRPESNFVRERLMDLAAERLGLDPAEIRRRNVIRPDDMLYDCGTVSFGVNTVYDSEIFRACSMSATPARLPGGAARAGGGERTRRSGAPGHRPGLYVEKTGLGPFETAHVEARPDGRFTVDTGAASMGPGLETVLAQIWAKHFAATRSLRGSTHRHGDGGERYWDLRLARHGHRRQRRPPRGRQAGRRGSSRAAELWGVRRRHQVRGRRAGRRRSADHDR